MFPDACAKGGSGCQTWESTLLCCRRECEIEMAIEVDNGQEYDCGDDAIRRQKHLPSTIIMKLVCPDEMPQPERSCACVRWDGDAICGRRIKPGRSRKCPLGRWAGMHGGAARWSTASRTCMDGNEESRGSPSPYLPSHGSARLQWKEGRSTTTPPSHLPFPPGARRCSLRRFFLFSSSHSAHVCPPADRRRCPNSFNTRLWAASSISLNAAWQHEAKRSWIHSHPAPHALMPDA